MKNLFTLVVLVVSTIASIFAQPPQAFKYQAVVRDADGELISNQSVDIRISIRNGSPGGTIPYQEYFIKTTNEFGLVTLDIGTGTPLIGTFTDVDWSSGSKYMQVDYKDGAYYNLLGTTELLSVPYALYTERSADTYWGLNGSDIYFNGGNVGIGTLNPQAKLHVWGHGIFRGSLAGIEIGSGSIGGSISFTDGSTNFLNMACYNGKTILGGNIGIGTYDPANPLVIKTAAAGDAFNILDNADNYLVRLRHTGNNSGALYLYDGSNNNTVFLYGLGTSFINGGPLGLGTSSVSNAKLQIEGAGTYDAIIKINNTGTNGASFFMGSTNSDWGGGTNQNLFVMGHGAPSSANIDMTINSSGYVGIGTTAPASRLDVRGNVTVRDNATGAVAVELGTGLDYAEGFNVVDKSDIEPGTVLCIDPENPGHLKISKDRYDKKVAGIVAGANSLGTGISLGGGTHDFNVALAGRVYCNVDATTEAIEVGDLLTTSVLPGHAMKVMDSQKAQGAILGKAMQPLQKGEKGQILVLVTLQ